MGTLPIVVEQMRETLRAMSVKVLPANIEFIRSWLTIYLT